MSELPDPPPVFGLPVYRSCYFVPVAHQAKRTLRMGLVTGCGLLVMITNPAQTPRGDMRTGFMRRGQCMRSQHGEARTRRVQVVEKKERRSSGKRRKRCLVRWTMAASARVPARLPGWWRTVRLVGHHELDAAEALRVQSDGGHDAVVPAVKGELDPLEAVPCVETGTYPRIAWWGGVGRARGGSGPCAGAGGCG